MLLISGNVLKPMVAGKGEGHKIFIKNRINWIRRGESALNCTTIQGESVNPSTPSFFTVLVFVTTDGGEFEILIPAIWYTVPFLGHLKILFFFIREI